MSLIDLDLSEVSENRPVPPAAIYQFAVEKVPEVKPSKEVNEKLGRNANVIHIPIILKNEGEFKDYEMMTWITPDFEGGKSDLKRYLMALKLDPNEKPINLAKTVGGGGFVLITNQPRNINGVMVNSARVERFLIPGEQGHPEPKS
jgi:hypothetical protein